MCHVSANIKVYALPKYLKQLNETDISKMFLDKQNKNGEKYIFDHNDATDFLNKTKGDFIRDFLISTDSLECYPLEALIWAYAKDQNSRKEETSVIGELYTRSRHDKIMTKTSKNGSVMNSVDQIIYTYFSALKKEDRRTIIENSIKQKVVFLSEPNSGKVNDDIIIFLSDFYSNYKGNTSYIINGIGRAIYGLISDLKLSITKYLNQPISDLTFIHKNTGAQYGIIAKMQDEKRLFVKAHQNYPYKGYGQSLTANQSSDCIYDSTSIRLNSLLPVKSVDLREIFVYKILEYTGFGPKTHFVLNKKLEGGLFIGTEEISDFLTLKDIKNKEIKTYINKFSKLFNLMNDDNYVVKGDGDKSILVELTAFDIIARSMLLTDLNLGNFGFSSNDGKETVKIIDFIIADQQKILEQNQIFMRSIYSAKYSSKEYVNEANINSYIYIGIVFGFICASDITEYPNFLLNGTFKPYFNEKLGLIEGIELRNHQMEIMPKRKKFFGTLAKSKIGEYEKLKSLFSRTYEEICVFALKNQHVLALNKGIYIDENENYEDIIQFQIKNLEKYKDACLIHLKHIYDFFE